MSNLTFGSMLESATQLDLKAGPAFNLISGVCHAMLRSAVCTFGSNNQARSTLFTLASRILLDDALAILQQPELAREEPPMGAMH